MMMTPDLEPHLQPFEEENEQGIPIKKEGMVQTSEMAIGEERAQELPIHASKKKEVMNDSAEFFEEQDSVDGRRDQIGMSSMLEKKKRKHMSETVVEDLVREKPGAAYLEEPERGPVIPGVDSIRTRTMAVIKESIRSRRITKKRRSQRKATRTRASAEAKTIPVPPTTTVSPTTSTDLNAFWQLTLCNSKFY